MKNFFHALRGYIIFKVYLWDRYDACSVSLGTEKVAEPRIFGIKLDVTLRRDTIAWALQAFPSIYRKKSIFVWNTLFWMLFSWQTVRVNKYWLLGIDKPYFESKQSK